MMKFNYYVTEDNSKTPVRTTVEMDYEDAICAATAMCDAAFEAYEATEETCFVAWVAYKEACKTLEDLCE